jgi:hypothetical protein
VTLPATRFTALVGCRLPIQQAGMGGVSTPALAAAVAREGALGMIGAAGLSGAQIEEELRAAASPGARIGVNFLMPFLDMGAFEVAALAAPLVECFYGDPDARVVARAHEVRTLVAWQVGTCVEASDADPSTRSAAPPTRSFPGRVATAALYAGTSVDHVRSVVPAAEVIRELAADAAAARSRPRS